MELKDTADSILGFGVIAYGVYNGIKAFGSKSFKLISNRKIELINHFYFMNMDNFLFYKIPALVLDDEPEKTRVLQIYADIKVRTFRDEMYTAVERFQKNKFEHTFTEKQILKIFDNTINKYRKEGRKAIALRYNEKIAKIFDAKFSDMHSHAVIATRQAIMDICRSRFYNTCYDKMNGILETLAYAFNLTILDLERSGTALNGQLSKEFVKLGYPDENKNNFVTKEEFEMREKVQNMQLKELSNGR